MKTILAALGCAALLGGCAVVPADSYYSAPYAYGYGYDYGPYYAPGYYGYNDYGPTFGFSYYGGGHFRDHRRFDHHRGAGDHSRFHASAPGRWHSTSSAPARDWSARAAAPHDVMQRAAGPASNRVRPGIARTQRPTSMARVAPETRPAS